MSLLYSLLDEPLIGVRLAANGSRTRLSLPALFVALAEDRVRDFPALRPHQRHPWHAFLVQLAAMALHQAGQATTFADEVGWKAALLALTPDDADGAAWCLVTPPARPALMQAPVSEGKLTAWKNRLQAPDELDMLVTSKNHDLKAARMKRYAPEDWLLALVSLQTQEGFLGAGNYGISRMNGGFASRPALGAVPVGGWGRRWARDTSRLLDRRGYIVKHMGLSEEGGIGLVWLRPWNGIESLAFSALDPFYIEICRRVRLVETPDGGSPALAGIGRARARHPPVRSRFPRARGDRPASPVACLSLRPANGDWHMFHVEQNTFSCLHRAGREKIPLPLENCYGQIATVLGRR